MTTTKNGNELAEKLIRRMIMPPLQADITRIQETCALICRHAATIKRLAEKDCNVGLTAYDREQDKMCEARISVLVAQLADYGIENVSGTEFQGDPRGATVKLKMRDRSGDSFGGDDRMVVPGS